MAAAPMYRNRELRSIPIMPVNTGWGNEYKTTKNPPFLAGFWTVMNHLGLLLGTGGRTRTGMFLRTADFESAVSTISPLRRGATDYNQTPGTGQAGNAAILAKNG